MKRLILFLLFISLNIFGLTIYINLYDNSLIIDKKIYHYQGVAEKFRGKIKIYFEGVSTPNFSVPSNLLVLEDGQTIGTEGTIKVSEDVLNKLLELYQKNLIENVVIDFFPVEIYSDNKIIVKDYLKKEKLVEYLNLFLDYYELPEENIYYGEYDISPEKPEIFLTTFVFPDFGYYNVSFYDKGKVLIKTYINGDISTNSGTLKPGTYTIFVSAIDEIGLEATLNKQIIVPKSNIIIKNEYFELGSVSKFGKLNFVGNKNFYEITPLVATITNVIVRDTTKPQINVDFEDLFNNYSKIYVNVNDYSPVKTEILLNNKKIQSGIIKLNFGKNLLIVYSEDGFGNFSFYYKNIFRFKPLQNGLQFINEKVWFDVGGVTIKSPFIKVWINSNQKRWIYDKETNIIKIFP